MHFCLSYILEVFFIKLQFMKMENSLRDWDKSLETRQKEKPKLVVKDDEVNNDYANINTNSNNINNNNNNNGEL